MHECDFHYAVIPMMMSQILKSVDFTKTRKSRYLKNEILFFLPPPPQKKKNKSLITFNKRRYLHIPGALRYKFFSHYLKISLCYGDITLRTTRKRVREINDKFSDWLCE